MQRSEVNSSSRGRSIKLIPSTSTTKMIGLSETLGFWNEAVDHLRAGRSENGVTTVVDGLRAVREELPAVEWRGFTRSVGLAPLHAVLHQDPFTERAFRKPRGYSGDAVMLDYIYGSAPIPETTSKIGRCVYSYTRRGPAAASVMARRNFLASYIDAAARETELPRVLSVACGHLREAQRSRAVLDGSLFRFWALDQDERALAVVDAEQEPFGVETVRGSVRNILTGKKELGQFDMIYSAGLYDYLDDDVGAALTARLFSHLDPGGRLLITNFTPSTGDIGYMEAIMDWWLIYRNEADMFRLAENIDAARIASQKTWRDALGNIVYLELQRG
jgi:extracellular factor (EF) 3-hydroxypalmitic acid methyl ester biosynthesis protein